MNQREAGGHHGETAAIVTSEAGDDLFDFGVVTNWRCDRLQI